MQELNIAFKEWDAVVRALGSGATSLLLRKGGIHERHGRFEVEHGRFLLYPTFLHQRAEMLKPSCSTLVHEDETPGSVVIRFHVQVEQVLLAPMQFEPSHRWNRLHVYAPALVQMRYEYKPERPLYVVLVRVHRLPVPITLTETPAYAGCRSWVTLDESIDLAGSTPVLSDSAHEAALEAAREALDAG